MNSANPRVVHIFSRDEWLYDTPAERARIAAVIADERRDIRVMRVQSFVKWGSLVVALVTVIYFAGQFARGAF